MKILTIHPERCTGCGACETTCSLTWFKVEDREKSSIRISPSEGEGGGYQIVVCDQKGACIDVCPVNALTRAKNGVVLLNKKLCVGCLACVGFCPSLAMFFHSDYIEPFKCVACGKCVDVCPVDALAIEEVEDAPPAVTDRWLRKKVR